MTFETKKKLLMGLYSLYDSLYENLEKACKLHCSSCCTRNVTMTTLEGLIIADYLLAKEKTHLFERIRAGLSKNRFQPRITTNQLAELCLKGKDAPEEDGDLFWGQCPLLEDDVCTIYPARPFGCRCFISKKPCREAGAAEVDPLTITINHLFLQYIEHIDSSGWYGNLTDVLLFVEYGSKQETDPLNRSKQIVSGLVPNGPLKHLIVPTEHRTHIQAILSRLENELNACVAH